MKLRLAFAIIGSTALSGADAHAHAFLVRSDPAVGATLASAPKTLRIEFTESIELAFSGIDMANGSGTALMIGKPRLADSHGKILLVDLPALQPGNYRVRWHVVSLDTHRTEGDFTFSLK